jgi:two-component system, sensor histidine kinase RpfC
MSIFKNTELIQSLIRLCIGVVTYVYISSGIKSNYFDASMETLHLFTLVFFTFSFIVMLSLSWIPSSTARRYLALCFDVGSTTFSAFLTGGINSVFVLVYLWIYIGYGTRYGKKFLTVAVALTLVGYNILLVIENAWSLLTLDAMAFLLLIITLPFYLYSLQNRLQKAIRKAEKANKAKTNFLSTMTHQIRTPIGGVVGMIDLLNKTKLDTQQKQYLQALSQSSNSLQEIIEDIVDFSQIEQGEILFNQQSFQPRILFSTLIHSLAPLAHKKNINLNYHINELFPYHCFGDAQRLRQLLSNLIRHAIDNAINDCVYVDIHADDVSIDGHVNVTIKINFTQKSNAERIYINDIPSTDEALALRVGSQLTRLMDGGFDISYNDDNKPVFTLNFNWKLDELKPANIPPVFNNKRVLIFEPDEVNRSILEKYCSQLGIENFSSDGKDNLIAHILWAQKKDNLFDAIILCETLKQNNALELIQRIRHEANCQAPILYATYIKSIELTKADSKLDAQQSITKPISLEDLARSLSLLLEDSEESPKTTKTKSSEKLKILVAEDSEINANVIYSHLTDMGHYVDIATDGNTALYAMHKHHYDIVFMDLNMPNMDGIDATRQWRKLEVPSENGKILPVIALTAKATSEDKKQCMDAGMDAFLTKPVNATQLAEVLETFAP